GFSSGKIDVLAVKTGGKKASYEIVGTNSQFLKIFFEKPFKKGEEVSVYIEFKCYLPNVYHRYGYGEDTINLTGFYPIACVYENGEYYQSVYYPAGDPFYSECADYKVSLTVPSTFVVASSLSPVQTVWSGGETEYLYERECVRDIAFILSQKYNVLKESVGGVDVAYYYYADNQPENTLSVAVSALEYFSNKYFEYPYDTYVVAEGDFIYGGMEYPCLSLISDSVGSYRDYTVVHETAHQWFYGIVGVNESEIGFLDEGLTEFSTALFMGENGEKSYGEYISEAKNSYGAIKGSLVYLGVTAPPVMDRNLKDFSNELEYVMIAYNRSEIMVDSLRLYMGDKKFFKTLKGFVKDHAFENVTVKDFTKAFEKGKKGAGKLIEDFVSGKTL
ncbi:MAG: M1 family metallopeptidase, partial [Clostridia bacterium]|nr:M1 family metallopeptidase [Clostridia bacterium]